MSPIGLASPLADSAAAASSASVGNLERRSDSVAMALNGIGPSDARAIRQSTISPALADHNTCRHPGERNVGPAAAFAELHVRRAEPRWRFRQAEVCDDVGRSQRRCAGSHVQVFNAFIPCSINAKDRGMGIVNDQGRSEVGCRGCAPNVAADRGEGSHWRRGQNRGRLRERRMTLLNERRSLKDGHFREGADPRPASIVLHSAETRNPLEVDDGGWSHATRLHVHHKVGAARKNSRSVARGREELDRLIEGGRLVVLEFAESFQALPSLSLAVISPATVRA